jgi:hypothetical protein
MGAAVSELVKNDWKQMVSCLTDNLATIEQAECPLKHYFTKGVYIREIFMPANTVVIGKIHKTEHFNIIQKGRLIIVHEDFRKEELVAPMTFISKAGVRKVLYIIEDTVWSTVHLTDNRDLETLELELIEPENYPVFDRTHERKMIEVAAS